MQGLCNDSKIFSLLFETIPCGMIIIDGEGRVQGLNPEGRKLFCVDPSFKSGEKGGELFRCVNAGDGCGTAAACKTCILRTNALKAIHGQTVTKEKGKFLVNEENGERREFTFLISAVPVTYSQEKLAVLMVQDISLVTELSGLIPICSCCHHIRDEKGEWVNLTKYLREHSEADFTHDYCPNCMEQITQSLRDRGTGSLSLCK